ncbi:SigE family RNA polymerase sigma factor [Motilibacter peucedani]|uniref:SigE family RNA polymerase sigma factor n=1 Tax=Motilibacter peucedani TaxID=598650 RepID=UPI000EB440E9|nr:SigE family RNA polymerase sigma factor [Motilibacter peucedani]
MVTGERDREEFTAFVAGSARRLLHVAELACGDRHRAEDLVQSALMGAYLRWDKIRDEDPFAYVRRSVLNGQVSWWRRHSRESLTAETPDDVAADTVNNADDRDALRRALARLTRRERAVVILRFIEDLSEQQTALELGIAAGTVKSTSARALAKLRAQAAEPVGDMP